jgi:catechol 2,3-dioxygenase-like lactoylglutathione lyase family enzyme
MSSNQTGKPLRSAPYFPISDVERSVTFYEQVLGFRCEYPAGTPLQYEKQGGTWDAFFWVNDAEAFHAGFNTKGAEIVYGPVIQEAYQMKEFAVRDCDGHVLGFRQAL